MVAVTRHASRYNTKHKCNANKRRITAFTRRFNINPTAIKRWAHGTDAKRKCMRDDRNRCVQCKWCNGATDNTVTQGGSVTFTCQVTAAKPQGSQYRFFLNDTTLLKDSNNTQYTINNVQWSQHYSKYKCVPHNDVGDGPEAAVILSVNGELIIIWNTFAVELERKHREN